MVFNVQPTNQHQMKASSIFSVNSTWSGSRTSCIYRTPGKINRFAAFTANMFFIEFIGENFFLLATFRTPAGKRLQILELLESGTVLWCRHFLSPHANDSVVVKRQSSCQAEAHRAEFPEGSPGFINRLPQLPWLHEPTEH